MGCGAEEVRLPVSGTVTHSGKPLAEVNVMMIRQDGMNTMVTTDANGRFSSGGEGQVIGVPEGTYKVGVTPKTTVDPSDIAG